TGRGRTGSIRWERPVKAAGLRVNGFDNAAGTSDEQRSVPNRRRRERRHVSRKTQSPFQLQFSDLVRHQARGFSGLVPRVGCRWAPAVPTRSRTMVEYRPVSRTHRARRNRRVVSSCSEEIRDSLSLFSSHRIGDTHHESEIQRPEYASRGDFLKRFARWNSGADLVVAPSASRLIDFFSRSGGFEPRSGKDNERKYKQHLARHGREYTTCRHGRRNSCISKSEISNWTVRRGGTGR